MRLLLHREASSVLADAFELYANAYERSILLKDFYGKEAALFTVTLGSDEEKEKSKKKNKGKGRATEEFRVVRASMLISIPPVFANNLRAGAEEMLDSLLMRCAVLLFSESHPE